MKTRDDIDIENTWLVSDTHFGHENIIGFCHRPEDHEQAIIAEWRRAVPDDATVLHLGDLCYRGNAWFKNVVAPELTGERKLLIRGNHDKKPFKFYRDCGFKIILPFAIQYDSVPGVFWDVSFSHYPWNEAEEGRMNAWDVRIHGHIHNNGYSRDAYVPFLKGHVNVSIEQTKYTPVHLGTLLRSALLGDYPETTAEQLAEARQRKDHRRDASQISPN